jgi:hypothetical protein
MYLNFDGIKSTSKYLFEGCLRRRVDVRVVHRSITNQGFIFI